jgi:hypothetical protein
VCGKSTGYYSVSRFSIGSFDLRDSWACRTSKGQGERT